MLSKRRQLAFQMLKFTPKDEGIASRLPEEYKKFSRELFEQPKPVHYVPEPGKWKRDPDTGIVTPVQNIPLPTKFPRELNNTLLGGEMVIRGFQKRKPMARRVPFFWTPHLHRSVVYSEILNKQISAIVTQRLILQIHDYKGFDNYLLMNKACDLRSNLALKIKKSILTALLEKDLPYDEARNNEIYEKYKKFIIPKEELEWFGLSFKEACNKQLAIEEAERRYAVPAKFIFRKELIEELREAGIKEAGESAASGEKNWLAKLKGKFTSDSSV